MSKHTFYLCKFGESVNVLKKGIAILCCNLPCEDAHIADDTSHIITCQTSLLIVWPWFDELAPDEGVIYPWCSWIPHFLLVTRASQRCLREARRRRWIFYSAVCLCDPSFFTPMVGVICRLIGVSVVVEGVCDIVES